MFARRVVPSYSASGREIAQAAPERDAICRRSGQGGPYAIQSADALTERPMKTLSADDRPDEVASPRTGNGALLTLGAFAAALMAGCGYLWWRYGAQVFFDAAAIAWRTCF